MSSKNICNDKSEVDDKISALFTNAAAVRAVAEAQKVLIQCLLTKQEI